jgi:tetratricopeptide (TPR) repeat protein
MAKMALRLQLAALALASLSALLSFAQASTNPLSDARDFVASGRLAKAESTLHDYLADHPESADAHFLMGYVLFRRQKPAESLAEFTAGAKFRRPAAPEFEIIASDYVQLEDFSDADKWFTEVVTERPKDDHAWYLLGRTKYKEGRHEEAVASFEHALALHPKYVEAEDNLGLALRELNKQDQAREAFQQAIAWQGDKLVNPQPLLNLGTLLIEQQQPEKALPLLEKAVALAPENPTIHEQLGVAYAAQNDLPRAQSELQAAVKLAPDTSALHFKLGEIYRKQKMHELAQQEFAICAKLNSTHSSRTTPNPFQPVPDKPQ